MNNQLSGQCLCGVVKFSLSDKFKAFYQCHCKQCQQLTGSAFASNLFTETDNISWDAGQEHVTCYEHASREFSKSFCAVCGSAVPFVNKSETSLVVPAGCLNQHPKLMPQANIFVAEQACWLEAGAKSTNYLGFPEQ